MRPGRIVAWALYDFANSSFAAVIFATIYATYYAMAVLGSVGYEGALVYYNAYLPDLAPPSHQGRVSGWGFATGYAGSIVALLSAYPFVQAKNYGGAFLATAALFTVFSLPAFIFLP